MMKKKSYRRPIFWVISILLLLLIIMVILIFVNLPKPLHVSDSSYNLTTLADGTYQGECDNGLVYVKVNVEVKNHSIIAVHIIEHDNGKGQSAEVITNNIVDNQSIELDVISGATASSQTILKAVENALSK